ncbi:MAG: peptidase, partial [Calditrichia bacterium]|nr:peptidase [Calditrichia bacterium]
DAYFNHVLMHEMSHGIGPGKIVKDGQKTSVNKELKNLYSTIEEAKDDILGVYNLQFMIDKGIFPKKLEENLYVSFLGGIFRSVRFGISAAHGGANIISLNYILEKGGFEFDTEKVRFGVNPEKIKPAIKELAHELLMIEALGDYKKAQEFMKKYRFIPESLKNALEKVSGIPVDIRPEYAIEKEI